MSDNQSDVSENRRVYVGNLAYATREDGLTEHLSKAGPVEFAEVLTQRGGRSKGCAIVSFATAEAARNAIATLNDTELDGRKIFVREDREPLAGATDRAVSTSSAASASASAAPRSAPASSSSTARTGPAAPPAGRRLGAQACFKCGSYGHFARECKVQDEAVDGRKLFLPYSIAWQDLKDMFSAIGPVMRADVFQESKGRSKGVGVVIMETAEDALKAIEELNGKEISNRVITVREDRPAARVNKQ